MFFFNHYCADIFFKIYKKSIGYLLNTNKVWGQYEVLIFVKVSYAYQGYIYLIKTSAVKLLIAINRIQNKILFTCVYTVYIYYAYINTHTCMYIFKKYKLCLYI